MLHEKPKGMAATVLAAAVTLSLCFSVNAGPCKSHACQPSYEVFNSPFFGYYPTCWRAWPGGQPVCPPAVLLSPVPLAAPPRDADKAPPVKKDGKEEKLPSPMPVKPGKP
jgi:hypothetical protein